MPPNTVLAVHVLPPLLVFRTTLLPWQKVVAPAGVMVAAGNAFTVIVPVAFTLPQPPVKEML